MNTHRSRGSAVLPVIVAAWLVPLSPASVLAQQQMSFTTKSPDALKLFLQGRDHLENIEFETAAPLFDEAIQADPAFAMAYLFRAQSGGGFQVFRQNLDRAVALSTNVSAGEREWILFVKASADNYQTEAKAHLDKLLALFPSDPHVYELAGGYYGGQANRPMAIQAYRKATELDRNFAPAYNQLGYALSAEGKYADAEDAFRNYIRLRPDAPNPYDSYAELLLKMGRYDDSIAQYRKALEKNPAFASSRLGIGNNYVFKGDYDEARRWYQEEFDRAAGIDGKIPAMNLIAASYVHQGRTADAVQTCDRWAKLASDAKEIPATANAHATATFILREAGMLDDAAKHLAIADALWADPSLPERVRQNLEVPKMFQHAYLLIWQRNFDAANRQIDTLRQVLAARNNPSEQRGLNQLLGTLALKQGEYVKALELFANANQDDPYVWYYTALANDGTGDRQKATALYRRIGDWNQNGIGYAVVRPRALSKLQEGTRALKP